MNPISKQKQNMTQMLHLTAPWSSCLIWNLKTQKMKLCSHTFGGKHRNMKLKLFHTKLGSNNISIVELYQKPMTYKKKHLTNMTTKWLDFHVLGCWIHIKLEDGVCSLGCSSDPIHVLQQLFVNLHHHQNLVVQLDSLCIFFILLPMELPSVINNNNMVNHKVCILRSPFSTKQKV
jgi:hypothetical protein